MILIVDGNNTFHTLKLELGPGTAPAEAFLQKIELAAATRDWEATVVFDGPQRYLPRESGLLVVQYAGGGKTADSQIERMVYQTKNRSEVVVVTRDRAEADLVLGLGALVWSPERLLEELEADTV